MDMLQKLSIATRAPFLGASLMPALVAGALAINEGVFNAWIFLLATLAVVFAHLGTNAANDYYDYKSGNFPRKKTGPTGGSFAIQCGLFTQEQIFLLFCACFIVSLALFAVLATFTSWAVFGLGLLGILIGFFYTAPPLHFSYRFPIGEMSTFIGMGPLLVQTVFFAQAGHFSHLGWYVSIFIGLLVSNILLSAQLPDEQIDRKSSKRTLTIALGKNATILAINASAFLAALSLVAGFFLAKPNFALLGIAGLYPYLNVPKLLKKGEYAPALMGCVNSVNYAALACCAGLLL